MAQVARGIGVEFKSASINESEWLTAEVIINTTPQGTLDEIAHNVFKPVGLLLDVVYNPWPTQLAASWAVNGGTIVSGLSMLLHQAGHQVTLMTGQPAPISQMRQALNVELLSRD
jgi:shikimate dehydrogenase